MIDLVMLKDFLVLCRIKSFSRAAQECHVSVSGLSRRIQTWNSGSARRCSSATSTPSN